MWLHGGMGTRVHNGWFVGGISFFRLVVPNEQSICHRRRCCWEGNFVITSMWKYRINIHNYRREGFACWLILWRPKNVDSGFVLCTYFFLRWEFLKPGAGNWRQHPTSMFEAPFVLDKYQTTKIHCVTINWESLWRTNRICGSFIATISKQGFCQPDSLQALPRFALGWQKKNYTASPFVILYQQRNG